VKLLGAEIEYGKPGAGGPFEILIDAPAGFHWASDGVHCLVESQWSDQPTRELWEDALNRVGHGLEACDPDSQDCQDAAESEAAS